MKMLQFKHTLPLQIRFNDIDLLGHLNNTVYFAFFDLGKTAYLECIEGEDHTKWQSVVIANINVNFIAPIFLNEKIAVQTTIIEIGNRSFKLAQQIIETKHNTIKCYAETTMVGFDIQTNTSHEITLEWKEAACLYENRDLLRKSDTK